MQLAITGNSTFLAALMDLNFHHDPAIVSQVIDTMADGLFTVDATGRFVAWNKGAARITGYSQQDVIGQPCTLLEGVNCKGFASLKDLLDHPQPGNLGRIHHQECKLLSKDGHEVYIHGNVKLIVDTQGCVAGAVGSFTDLTSFIIANQKIALLEEQNRLRNSFDRLVGASDEMQEVFRRLRLAAQSDVSVFISGESGTGKELAARAIHSVSSRASAPFIGINCSAIPETLLESELFGHVKGAFTGAVKDKLGLFQAAEGGTLFLDEIGDVTPHLQLKLLRVLQEREIRRVGDERPYPIDVRLITATNRDLKSLITEGKFREDFYYRIHVFEIRMPPLRRRRDDIPLLAELFMREFARLHHKPVTCITREALDRLRKHDWPGNVRELRNAIEHAFVTVNGDTITLLDLPHEIRRPDIEIENKQQPPPPVEAAQPSQNQWSPEEIAEQQQIAAVLESVHGNKTQAAKILGISRVTMWKKARKYGFIDKES